jgi:hypothetical protein
LQTNGSGSLSFATLPVAGGGTGATSLASITVGTATTATTATTSTNLAGGSNGTIPYQTSSGTTAMLAVGTAGQVLQTNGAGAPSWITASAGAMTLISTLTASASASLDWTNLNAAKNYLILFSNFKPTTTGQSLNLLCGTGSTFSTSNYYWCTTLSGASSVSNIYGNNDSSVVLDANIGVQNSAVYGASGFIYVTNNPTTSLPNFTAQVSTYVGGSTHTCNTTGFNTVGGQSAFKLMFASGTIAVGTASLYSIST